MNQKLKQLENQLKGDLFYDEVMRKLYSTDASAYKEMPLAVALPKGKDDIKKLIAFANENKTSLIPRTAGTSLAGQVVGKGIVVDVSKYWNKIIEVNKEEKWVRVEPGVVLDELNMHLKDFGLFFGPETSTANRCMIGGMVGNNSCGSHSVIYGTTRDHVLELETILADGSDATFKAITKEEFQEKKKINSFEGKLYNHIDETLSVNDLQDEIRKEFPKPNINRRNTGYAIDVLLESEKFTEGKEKFNFCKLLAGSEGTLAFTTEIKLNLVDVPGAHKAVMAVHLNNINEAARANLVALKFKPGAVELIDDIILDCTKKNIEQQKNRFFVEGEPGALLVVEFARDSAEEIEERLNSLEAELKKHNLGYHFPRLHGKDVGKVWSLRKAGLGLLANIPGDPKAVPCIEDTAVDVEDLPEYLEEFQAILDKHKLECVYYAHIGDGEIHLRPVLDLKIKKDRDMFFTITDEVASLVKKYNGSLSGEHGDGRVRGEFVRKMIGEKNYKIVENVKDTWDPNGIFNPGKIVRTPKMNEFLRYDEDQNTQDFDTIFDFSETDGILRMAEKCNGSGDCRKSSLIGGTMCPSFQATKNEKDTTRARANILRDVLSNNPKVNKFDSKEIYEVMDLCLACKGCKSECPSNVDVTKLKTEFLQKYYDANGVPLRSQLIGNLNKINKVASIVPGVTNFFMNGPLFGSLTKSIIGIHPNRDLPALYKTTLASWWKKNKAKLNPSSPKKKIYFFNDEFTNYNDVTIGITALRLLTTLGYEVEIPQHEESARTYLSKGLLKEAQKIAHKNIDLLKDVITEESPLIGLEPSGILGFRDEYLSLAKPVQKEAALKLSKNCFMIEEFISKEFEAENISKEMFTEDNNEILLHGHCHQKAISSPDFSKKIMEIPKGHKVEVIPSGCCGMAGSFGYEKEHYDISMKVANLVLIPAVKNAEGKTIAAPGTSCRHQIKDGANREAMHPVEVLFNALKK